MLEAILAAIYQLNGTPYTHSFGPGGVDCSGLVSVVANVASGQDAFAHRFSTATESGELAARGFQPGTAPGALVVGWNDHHTALTLPDGTHVSSGEVGGVAFGGGGAYQPQFNNHAYLYIG